MVSSLSSPWKVFSITLLSLLLAPAPAHAGELVLKHKTVRPKINLQTLESPKPTKTIEKDNEKCLNLGIGEVVKLWIETNTPKVTPQNLESVTWKILRTTGGAKAYFSTTPETQTKSAGLLALDPFCQEMDAQEAPANSPESDGPQTRIGRKVDFKVAVKDVSDGASVTIEAKYGDSPRELTFSVVKPKSWKIVCNAGKDSPIDSTTGKQKPEIVSYASDEERGNKRFEHMFTGPSSEPWMKVVPSNVNFENVYYQEVDLESPINMKPAIKKNPEDTKTIGETLFGDAIHQTGDSWDGYHIAPSRKDKPNERKFHPIYPINYEERYKYRKDSVGGGIGSPSSTTSKGILKAKQVSTKDLKASIDAHGEHGYSWKCGWKLHATPLLPPEVKLIRRPRPTPREKPPQPLTPFAEMEPCIQTFSTKKESLNNYINTITKWDALSEQKVCLKDENVEIIYCFSPKYSEEAEEAEAAEEEKNGK